MNLSELFGIYPQEKLHQCGEECLAAAIHRLPWVEEVTIDMHSSELMPGGVVYYVTVRHSYPEGVDVEPLVNEWARSVGVAGALSIELERVEPGYVSPGQ